MVSDIAVGALAGAAATALLQRLLAGPLSRQRRSRSGTRIAVDRHGRTDTVYVGRLANGCQSMKAFTFVNATYMCYRQTSRTEQIVH